VPVIPLPRSRTPGGRLPYSASRRRRSPSRAGGVGRGIPSPRDRPVPTPARAGVTTHDGSSSRVPLAPARTRAVRWAAAGHVTPVVVVPEVQLRDTGTLGNRVGRGAVVALERELAIVALPQLGMLARGDGRDAGLDPSHQSGTRSPPDVVVGVVAVPPGIPIHEAYGMSESTCVGRLVHAGLLRLFQETAPLTAAPVQAAPTGHSRRVPRSPTPRRYQSFDASLA
jgi:hypothetical protein